MTGTHQIVLPMFGRSFHMMGIGGAGVSALAQLADAWGAHVTGCDNADSTYIGLVRARGIDVTLGHDAAHVDGGSELVVSSAVSADHPERVRAGEVGVRTWLRGELLGELTRARSSVVVAGAHGKSTTTAMIVHAAVACGVDVSMALGGTLGPGGNVRIGASEWFVVEGDESDRTLLHLAARIAVVTNIERDHHHTFATDAEVDQLFADWIGSLADDAVVVVGPGAACDRLVATVRPAQRVVRFGDDEVELAELEALLPVPGRHNALNAAAAVAALTEVGVGAGATRAALAAFPGVGRRFERVGSGDAVRVVDDYAHHPTEVAAALQAGRVEAGSDGRLIVIFQPHLYSRTRELHAQFGVALAAADVVVLLPVFGAREAPVAGVTSQLIADSLAAASGGRQSAHVLDVAAATGEIDTMLALLRSGDLVMTMGAGDITKLAPRLVAALAQRAAALGSAGAPA